MFKYKKFLKGYLASLLLLTIVAVQLLAAFHAHNEDESQLKSSATCKESTSKSTVAVPLEHCAVCLMLHSMQPQMPALIQDFAIQVDLVLQENAPIYTCQVTEFAIPGWTNKGPPSLS